MNNYTFHVGMKFHEDGSFKSYPGATIISKIKIHSIESSIINECQTVLKQLPFSNKFAFLPQDSFHMTVFELVNDRIREQEKWSKLLALDTPMDQVDQLLTEKFAALKKPDKIKMKIDGILTKSVIAISLQPYSQEQERVLHQFRENASEMTGVRKPGHDNYKFHITLAYKLIHLTEQEEQHLTNETANLCKHLNEKMPSIELDSPELTFYHDMSAFYSNRIERQ